MSGQHSNTHRNLKDKLDAHEFDFNPGAWGKMEDILDGKRTPNKSYFLTKIIIAMMTGLFLLWLLFWKQDAPSTGQAATTADVPTRIFQKENTPEPADAPAVRLNHPSAPAPAPSEKPLAGTMMAAPPDHPLPVTHHQDTSFFEKIAAKLALFHRHYSPEKVYLQFDRTFFEPGEAVWFNAWVREANSLKASTKSELLYVELLAPNGSVLNKITLLAKGGTAAGDFQLDPAAPGGLYKIKAYTNWQRNAGDAFERDIQVQATVLPRLRMELDFLKKAYGPGDPVEAKLDLNTLANQPLAGQEFSATVSLDGQQFTTVAGKTDGKGRARIQFKLPDDLTTNDGLLNVLIGHNGQTESISRSVPIVLNKVDLQFLPEGGDLVAGLPATVAFKALNEFGKPADVEGEIFNSKGERAARFQSYHQGMGAFEITPEPGEAYTARLTKPEGITEKFTLPDALPRGFALRVTSSLIPHPSSLKNDTLQVEISSTENEPLNVAVVSRGDIYFTQTLRPVAGAHIVKIPVETMPIGIAQVVLFDSREIPRAERLVFLNPHKKLNVSILTDKEKYLPREKVKLTVKVADERGLPMPGHFSLAVVDDNLLTFADDRQGRILAHLLLESELQGKVEEPNFYFEKKEKHPEKDQLLALDFLMMTQGWRRFDWGEVLWEQPVAMGFEGERLEMQAQLVDVNGKPFPFQKVTFIGSSLSAVSDENGWFTLDTIFPNNNWSFVRTVLPFHNPDKIEFTKKGAILKIPVSLSSFDEISNSTVANQPKNKRAFAGISGKVIDRETGEPLIGANAILIQNSKPVQAVVSDIDGSFSFDVPQTGLFDLEFSYTGYEARRITSIPLTAGKAHHFDLDMKTSFTQLSEVVVTSMGVRKMKNSVAYSRTTIPVDDNSTKSKAKRQNKTNKPASQPQSNNPMEVVAMSPTIIQPANTTQGATLTSEQIKNLPTRDVNALASMSAGVAIADEGEAIHIRGSRSDATDYYIDGVRMTGRMLPKQEIGQIQVVGGGVPAQFATEEEMKEDLSGNMVGVVSGRKSKKKMQAEKEADELMSSVFDAEKRSLPAATTHQIYIPRQFYAPKYDANQQSTTNNQQRTDFRKTVFFEPNIKVGRSGKATVEFYNSDAITTFRATVEGLGVDGSTGQGEQRFFTQMPFGMDVKIPTSLLTGDRLTLPLTLMNNSSRPLSGKLDITAPAHFTLVKPLPETVELKAGETKTLYPEYEVGFEAKTGGLQVAFRAGGMQDAFAETIEVRPRGFPVRQVFGGNQPSQVFEVEINDPVEGSLDAAFTVHPSVLSELTSGLEKMLRQPGGCFEQTSSGNYPNVLVLNFLQKTNNADADLVQTANGHLDHGYKRLKTFEVSGGGFDWYGKPPAHVALTAYGLMQFVDMKNVYPVEQALIDRTAQWLLTRSDGQGGWENSRPGLHSWNQKSPVADAYITWALTEAGFGKQVGAAVEKTVKDANSAQDPYLMALAANILLNLGDGRAGGLLKQLAGLQNADGSWSGLTHSMTHSTGKNLTVETTALAALAFLKTADRSHGKTINAAVDYLAAAKTHYGFGSTQATVLALKALVRHAENTLGEMKTGPVAVFVNGQKAAGQTIAAGQNEPIVLGGLAPYFKMGKNVVEVKFADSGKALPYDLSVSYHTRQPQSSADCQLGLTTSLSTAKDINMGATVRLTTTLTNKNAAGVPNPIAIVGIPAGLSIQPWQVKELQEKNLFDFYEIQNGYVVFYFREMAGQEVKTIHLDLKADIPGEFEAPASSAYLYYANDAVVWSKPERVRLVKE